MARDRSREPLHLADLSLDDWHTKTFSDNQQSEGNKSESTSEKETNKAPPEGETPPHASSMPELAVPGSSESTTGNSGKNHFKKCNVGKH